MKSCVQNLESWQETVNNDIGNAKTIVEAFENSDYILAVTPVMGSGNEIDYTITFSIPTITAYHGKAGDIVPIVKIEENSDRLYYWTVKYDSVA